MHTTNLRKVGGSVMLAVPPAILDILGLQPGAKVDLAIEDGRLVIAPKPRRRYELDQLLSQCVSTAEATEEDLVWLGGMAAGSELL